MPRIVKLVWRLDFKPSFAFLDARGKSLERLINTRQDFWDVAGDGQIPNSYVARTSSDKAFRTLSMEATNINGSVEWASGIELDRALQDESFKGQNDIVRELLKIFEVPVVVRAGIRLYCLNTSSGVKNNSGKDKLSPLLKSLSETSAHIISSVLGTVDDVAFTFEGVAADKVKYRLIYGPYFDKNVIGILERKPTEKQLQLLSVNDLFFDLDLYENDISFVEHHLFRWANTKLKKAVDFIAAASKMEIKG